MHAIPLDVGATSCVVNNRDGSGYEILTRHLRGAFVVDVAIYRKAMEHSYEAVSELAGEFRPPRCEIVQRLRAYGEKQDLNEDEVVLMVLCGRLITKYSMSPALPIAITIGFYTMPIARGVALRLNGEEGLDVVRKSDLLLMPERRGFRSSS
jgi:hypothetical protein